MGEVYPGPLARSAGPQTTGFIVFDGVAPLDIAGPIEAFAKVGSGKEGGQRFHRVVMIGVSGKKIATEAGLTITAQATLADAPVLDTIVVPGGSGIQRGATCEAIKTWLTRRVGVTPRVVSICGGIYPLAATGLLANRTVTTHWRYIPDLARRFPELRINHSASFVKDGPFYTCGTSTGAIELALFIIEEDYGRTTALAIAKELVMQLRPPAAEGADALEFVHEPDYIDRFNDLPAWIAAHLHENLSIEILAIRAGLCPRHFSRLFKSKFGYTPGDFVENLRLSEARRRLLTSHSGVESVAHAVGFKSADSFRRAFERRVGMAPTRFRQQARLKARGQCIGQARPLMEKSAPLHPVPRPPPGSQLSQAAVGMRKELGEDSDPRTEHVLG